MSRRNKTCIDPLSAFGLVAGAFVAGVVTERAAGVTGKVETKAREQGAKLQKLLQANIESARREIDKSTDSLRKELAKAQEAIQGKTEPEWSEFEPDEDKPERYSHSNRIIKGRPYIITETTKSVGGQSFPAYLVLYGPKRKGGKWGEIKGDLYGAFEHLPLALQAAERHSGIRKNARKTKNGAGSNLETLETIGGEFQSRTSQNRIPRKRGDRYVVYKESKLDSDWPHKPGDPIDFSALIRFRSAWYPDNDYGLHDAAHHARLKNKDKKGPYRIAEYRDHRLYDYGSWSDAKRNHPDAFGYLFDVAKNKKRNKRRNGFGGKEARSEVLEAFYEHSRVSPKAVNKGIVELVFYVHKDRDAYEDAEPPTGPYHMNDMSEWVKVKPGSVVEVFIFDPNDPEATLSDKDSLTVLVEGISPDLKDSFDRYEEEQYGRAERSHRGNRRRRRKRK